MSAPTLFDSVRPSDPDTSHIAARLERHSLRDRVRIILAASDGMTDHELTAALRLDPAQKPTVGKRRQECGAVDTGLRRPSPSGSPCVVWRLS